MRILMLTSSYPIPGQKQWGPFIQSTAQAVQMQGVDVRVITLSANAEMLHFDDNGVDVYAYPHKGGVLHTQPGLLPSLASHPFSAVHIPTYIRTFQNALEEHIRSFKPDCIHAHWLIPSGYIVSRLQTDVPLVVTGWGADLHMKPQWFWKLFFRSITRRAAVVTTVSSYLKEQADQYGITSTMIPNCVDTTRFNSGEHEHDGKVHIALIGRCIERKNMHHGIALMEQLQSLQPHRFHMTLLGDGPLYETLQQAIIESSARDCIEIQRSLPHTAMPEFLKTVDLLFHPSTQEGMATVILEAMSSGIPVIAYDTCGQDALIQNGKTGFLVEKNSIESASKKILSLSPTDIADIGKSARDFIVQQYSMDSIGKQYMSIYNEFRLRSR